MIQHSGAHVLATYLYTTGIVSKPGSNLSWPLYVGTLPDQPAQAIVLMDTQGILGGRIQKTGRTLENPGWQFRIRANDTPTGILQGMKINDKLDAILRNEVNMLSPSKQYLIHAVRRTSPILPLGQEEGGQRYLFTINGTITYGENT